ncbi:MAG: efflux RND transporter periplasmic adaptor subunit [Candidatus Riflebacteria bacterium]|nr:efflux RND transporter periplasmic adaptor subunit [Candidatus Riflebacteria bacterium]
MKPDETSFSAAPVAKTASASSDSEAAGCSILSIFVVLMLLAAAVAGGVWVFQAREKAASAAAAAASALKNRIVPVQAVEVEQRDVPVWRDGLGTVLPLNTVTIKTQVDGRIDRVYFQEGQHVKKGDLLVQIDPRPFAIQLEAAEGVRARDQANLKNSRLNLERFNKLSSQKLIPVQQETDQKAEVDQLEAQVNSDQAPIDSAKLNLDLARITSPIDGVVGLRLIDPGNVVRSGDASGLVVVTQLDPISVVFTLPEDDLPDVIREMSGGAQLIVNALNREGELLGEGTLSVIDNQINQQTATIKLKAIFANPNLKLWPNQFVKAHLQLSVRKNALVVPAAVVQQGPNGTFAYIIASDSSAEMRAIVVEAMQGDLAVLKSGVALGEQVVLDGQSQLRPGSKVSTRPGSGGKSLNASASSEISNATETTSVDDSANKVHKGKRRLSQ